MAERVASTSRDMEPSRWDRREVLPIPIPILPRAAQASWLNDLEIKSFLNGDGSYNCNSTSSGPRDNLRISFKSSSKKDPTDLSIITVLVDQKNAATPWFFNHIPNSEEQLHGYFKILEGMQTHNNLIKYRKTERKMFTLEELKALLPIKTFSETGMKYVCSLMGRAACFESASVFCIQTQFGGPSLRRWLTAADHVKYSWENVERPTQSIPLKYLIKLRIVDDMNQGLSFLHSKRLRHHDLKPENIRFATEDFKFPVKLSNFSNFKYFNEHGNGHYYEAPELKVAPKKYTVEADIFSLGLVIWELFEEIRVLERFPALLSGQLDAVKRDPLVYNLDLLVRNYTAKDPQCRNKSRKGSPLKLIVLYPNIIPILYGLESLSDNATDKPLGRRVEIAHVLKAIGDSSKRILEIRGIRQTGKTSLVKKISSTLKGLKLNVVIMDDRFELVDLWNSVCQTVPGDDIVDDICSILSNRMDKRWIMIFDMNFCMSNPSLISRFNNFIKQFPLEKNQSPFIIFTSVDQYDSQLMDSQPVQLVPISDWQMDYFLSDASKLGMYANVKGCKGNYSHSGAKKIKAAFKELGIMMKGIKETTKKSDVLTAALSMFLLLGLSGGVYFNHLDLLELILSMKFEHEIDAAVPAIYNGFLSAKIFAKYVLKDKQGGSSTIRSLKCPKSVATVIRKVYSKRDFKKLLEKLLRLRGSVEMKRWLLDLLRGKKDNPIAKRCKKAVSERKRSGSLAIIPKAPTDRRLVVKIINRHVISYPSRNLNLRVPVSDGPYVLQAGESPLESLRNLAQETKRLGSELVQNHPITLDKSVDFIRASKHYLDEMCEAVHPLLLEKYGKDHQNTEFVKSLLPPVVVTLE